MSYLGADAVSGQIRKLPRIFGTIGAFSVTGGASFPVPLPTSARAGMHLLYVQGAGAATAPAPITVGELHTVMPRFGSGTGSNYTTGVYVHPLTQAEVTAGQIVLPALSGNQGIAGLLLPPIKALDLSLSPEGAEQLATSGFNRSADVLQNSLATPQITAPADAHVLAFAHCAAGGGLQSPLTPPADFVLAAQGMGGAASATRYSQFLAVRAQARGTETPAGNWTIGTALDKRLTTFVGTIRC